MKTFKLLIVLSVIFVNTIVSQWQEVYGTPYVYSLTAFNDNIYSCTGNGLIVSTNNGSNWAVTSMTNSLLSFTASGSNMFGGSSTKIYRSTNSGVNWSQVHTAGNVRALLISGTNIIAGVTSGILVSTNNGTNWMQTNLMFDVMAMTLSGTDIYAGTYSQGVYKSTNNGLNWTQTSLTFRYMLSMSSSGSYIYAGTQVSGVYTSTNGGANWTQSLNGKNIFALTSTGNSVYAGCDSGVFVSNNNAADWEKRNEGLGSYLRMGSLCVLNQNLFTGKESNSGIGIFKRPLSEISAVSQLSSEVPYTFILKQNYPNPFNPVTNIEFSVPKSSHIKLAVYDITGKQLEVLVNQNLSAGTYKADWDASKYSSGLFFYNIEAEGYSETKKMMLVK